MIKQKKQALKRLLVITDSQNKRLGESFYSHMGVSRFRFIVWASRFNLNTIVEAENCIKQNNFDQSHLIMGAESNCWWITEVRKALNQGHHSLFKNPEQTLKDEFETYIK